MPFCISLADFATPHVLLHLDGESAARGVNTEHAPFPRAPGHGHFTWAGFVSSRITHAWRYGHGLPAGRDWTDPFHTHMATGGVRRHLPQSPK